nr:creatininase family protein [Pantoea sp. SM3]
MVKPSSPWWWDLSTREFSELDMANMVAVLPIGAVEQHGPHLPVRVDAAINAGIIQRAVELMPDNLARSQRAAQSLAARTGMICHEAGVQWHFNGVKSGVAESGQPT